MPILQSVTRLCPSIQSRCSIPGCRLSWTVLHFAAAYLPQSEVQHPVLLGNIASASYSLACNVHSKRGVLRSVKPFLDAMVCAAKSTQLSVLLCLVFCPACPVSEVFCPSFPERCGVLSCLLRAGGGGGGERTAQERPALWHLFLRRLAQERRLVSTDHRVRCGPLPVFLSDGG